MKKLLIGFMAICTISAIAHPGNEQSVTLIDPGSTIIAVSDINIPARSTVFSQFGNLYSSFKSMPGDLSPYCAFTATDANGELLEQDSVVKGWSKLTLINIERSKRLDNGAMALRFETSKGYQLVFDCTANSQDSHGTPPSIGQFRRALKSVVILNLATPLEL